MSSMPTITVTPSPRPSEVYSIDGETFTTVTLTPSRQSTYAKSHHDDKRFTTTTTTTSRVLHPKDTEQRQQSWSSWLTSKSTTSSTTHQGWKPLSMTTPILTSLTLLTLLIAAAIELLAQQSRLKGGLALSPSLATMPNHAKWSYLYGPNVVAVLYSLLWSWVDLDVKRMQPWLELSKEEGARAEDSLFLDYPFDFVAMAPWRAGRKGHWMVVLAGTAMVLVFWAVTPLQSAVLGTGVVITNYTVPVVARANLIPLEEQAYRLNGEVSNQAFAIGWLNQSMPEFQSMNYAYAPFKIEETGSVLPGTNLTTETTRFSTELTCWPAVEKPSEFNITTNPMFNNGGNCTCGKFCIGSGDFPDAYTMGYTGFYPQDYLMSIPLRSEICPGDKDTVHQFLAGWKYPSQSPVAPKGKNWTAIFCQPEYYRQLVSLTVDAETKRPIEDLVEARSEKEILSEIEFNRTAFEIFLAADTTGVMAWEDQKNDAPYTNVPNQKNRMAINFNISRYTNANMVGYAMSLSDRPVQELGSPEALHILYSRAHKFMFSLAINHLSNASSTTTSNDRVTVTISRTGIIVSRTFAFATEAVLILVAIMTAMLVGFNRVAVSKLQCNPSSIERLGDLLRGEPSLIKLLRDVDNRDDQSLAVKLRSIRLALKVKAEEGEREEKRHGEGPRLVILESAEKKDDHIDAKPEERDPYYKPIRPLPLRKASGVAFVTCIVGAACVLIYFKILEIRNNGIQRPQASFETLQLLENVVPTIFATLTEPFWVLLTRNLCMLQPFYDLSKGGAYAKTTIETTYLSVPPQIVMFRAIKARHFLLLATCMMAFLANFLAVGLGALFNEKSIPITEELILKPALGDRLDLLGILDLDTAYTTLAGSFSEHYQIATANLSGKAGLPPWTTADYYFRPFHLPAVTKEKDATTLYTLQTRGYGINGNCTSFKEREFPADGLPPPGLKELRDDRGQWMECPDLIEAQIEIMQRAYNSSWNATESATGRSAWEAGVAWDTRVQKEVCNRTYVAGFARIDNISDTGPMFNASFAICRPYFETQLYNLTVDHKGLVHGAVPAGRVETTLGYPNASKHERWLINQATQRFDSGVNVWHNDTLTPDWTTHLMTLALGSRAFMDPAKPVPDASKLVPVMNQVYRLMAAAQISQYTRVFEQEPGNTTTIAQVTEDEIRIVMDTPAFIISMVVLGLNLVVAIAVYVQMSSSALPRMPSSIGSLLAYIAPSSLLSTEKEWGSEESHRAQTYGFGRFIGEDGRAHIGIERDPYVVPIDVKSLKGEISIWSGLLRRRKGGVEHDGPWL